MNNPYYPRGSGRTTMMLIRALASDKDICVIISPTQPMAKYNMRFFIDLIEKITDGRGEIKASKVKMSVEFLGKTFYFLSVDNKYSMDNFERISRGRTTTADEFKDHTVYEFEEAEILRKIARRMDEEKRGIY